MEPSTSGVKPTGKPLLGRSEIEQLASGRHPDPFGVLGPHLIGKTHWLRVFMPDAVTLDVLREGNKPIALQHRGEGVFEGSIRSARAYRLRAGWPDGTHNEFDDPFRFGLVLGEVDAWLLAEGSHLRPFEVLGAHPRTIDGVDGTAFSLWAPNASRVSVVGDFNRWDGRRHPMRLRRECGVWEVFLPGVAPGAHYKFELLDAQGHLLPLKADPHARRAELRPATASIVAPMPPRVPPCDERKRANALDAPISIYEVHLGSWRRKPEEGNRWLTWDELADTLVPYAAGLGFTHLELMPVGEHPFDGSWGYQAIGLHAPTSRFGSPDGLKRLIERAHAAGLGVLLDWVPAHFPDDAHGLAQFDGTHLYEYADPREGVHADWDTLIYNFGRTEVRNFLAGNALYWIERYAVDGLRVDAVASMLYRDYSRQPGEWVPNADGGRENFEAIDFLRRTNHVVGVECPQAVMLAEESTAFPAVSRPTYAGGLGFHYKWNLGWMHDTLQYLQRDPVHRRWHHDELSFSLVYAFDENFVLPLSHDEVVHGKGSILARMPGDRWQQFANLRAYYGFMFGHPGKKLLFMGAEFAQAQEWNHDQSLDWHLIAQAEHAGVQRLVHDLNHLLREEGALYERDFEPAGFEWIDHQDAERSLYSFVRWDAARRAPVLVVSNFTPAVHRGLRLGVPRAGRWRERLNTDSAHYGGSNVGTPLGEACSQAQASHGRPDSIVIDVPPLATVFLAWTA